MGKLPKELKLTIHAQQRLVERKNPNDIYNTKNLMKSSCKWYSKDDFIYDNALYRHSCYVTRKSQQMGYLTDGNIEILYNKGTRVVITILEMKEKFKPIAQYIKPELLKKIEIKKEKKKLKKLNIGNCPDCGATEVKITSQGICERCRIRKYNLTARGKEYVPYLQLTDKEKEHINKIKEGTMKAKQEKEIPTEIPIPDITIPDNFYQVKAENNPAIAHISNESTNINTNNIYSLDDPLKFIALLNDCGCTIPEKNLAEVLQVLTATDKLRNIFMTIVKDDNQTAMLDLEQALNVGERKLQHIWEYNGFTEEDGEKFKSFLTWRRILKSSIFFWKKLYQSNALIELQKAWSSYTADPTEKLTLAVDKDKVKSDVKRYQITTETISTILNTRRPFTRVFYATSEESAHEMLAKWLGDRQLHEDKSKTTIIELSNQGERVRV